ncbi:MAG: purine-binding chemotaxis protein CheW, partial [Hyphomonadaceae bacterium]|nr:purine-binding chemotaxis protein CheW [Clostridia bacterium]
MAVQSGKFLTFALGDEEYGIPIQSVKEINGILEITNIPKMPKFIKGVINLRGKIIPVIDLRLKFALQAIDYTERTCIIVVEMNAGETKHRLMGVVVDTVSEVVNILATDIEEPPVFENSTDISFITGIG